jgi:sugar lactone lactonase YvrE
VTLLDAPPNPDEGGSIDAGLMKSDGSAYLSFNTKVYKVANKVPTAVAGTGTATATGKGTEIAVKPSGMTIGTDGSLYFTDQDNGFVMKLGADGVVSQYAGSATSQDDAPVDGSPAKDAPHFGADAIHADAAGNLYLTSFDVIYKIDTAGKIHKFYQVASQEESISDFLIAPDGALFTVESYSTDTEDAVRLKRRAAGASTATLLKEDTSDAGGFVLCADGANVLVADNANSKLLRWTAAAGLKDVIADPIFGTIYGSDMVLDKQGRLIVCDTNRVVRLDLATKATTVLAGKGGKLFTGTTVDTSLDGATFPVVDAAGNLFIVDSGHRQIKKIPVDQQ